MFFFLVIFNNFSTIPVAKEKVKVRLALIIPTGAPKTLVNEITVGLNTIKFLSI